MLYSLSRFKKCSVLTALIFTISTPPIYAEVLNLTQEVEFSESELRTLKLIMNREDTIRDMSLAVAGLEAVNGVASMIVSGPAKLLVTWNKSNIEAWKSANSAMAKMAETLTCNEINLEIVDAAPGSDNEKFWKNFGAASGC